MKTNQMMEVNIGGFTLPIGHKTQMGSLNALWSYGNGLRKAKGLNELDMKDYLRSPDTIEFLLAVEKRYGTCISKCGDSPQLEYPIDTDTSNSPESGELESSIDTDTSGLSLKQGLTIEYDRKTGRAKIIGGELSIIKTKRGKYGGTWAHLQVLTHAAGKLSADFLVEIIHVFLNDKILGWRDIGGDYYKELNMSINTLPDRIDKNNHGIYIQIAKQFREKLEILDTKGYNEEEHNAFIQETRAKWLSNLIFSIDTELVTSYKQLTKILEKLK